MQDFNDEFQHLLTQGLSHVHATTSLGNTALHCTAYMGYTQTTQELLSLGANPYARNHNGQTPISLAYQQGHTDCFKILTGTDYVDTQVPLHDETNCSDSGDTTKQESNDALSRTISTSDLSNDEDMARLSVFADADQLPFKSTKSDDESEDLFETSAFEKNLFETGTPNLSAELLEPYSDAWGDLYQTCGGFNGALERPTPSHDHTLRNRTTKRITEFWAEQKEAKKLRKKEGYQENTIFKK